MPLASSNLVSYLNSLDPALICEQVTPREHDVRADPMYALVLAHYDCQVLTVAILSAPSSSLPLSDVGGIFSTLLTHRQPLKQQTRYMIKEFEVRS